ncbi:MAG: hypothetical protein C5B55_13660 [Blastocatellia bacterium]|nr:MAG: hypothetical protein C5B55_13660 [Blastocatellia bacterium]
MLKSTDKFRLLGLFPLLFFLLQAVHYWRINELGHMLWMCNIGNLLMAIGLFLERPVLTRIAIIWTIPGLVIWFLYVVLAWGVFFTSTLAHVGGIIIGMIVLKRIGMDRWTWLHAFVWYLAIQLLSHLITSPVLNVNLSHHMQDKWDQTFGAYWQFLLTLNTLTALLLWLVGFLLYKLRPTRGELTPAVT